MENLRWILLFAGIIFVIVVYVVSRQRRRAREEQQLPFQDELPEFSATDDLDKVDEGVGKVRIIARFDEPEADETVSEPEAQAAVKTEAASATQTTTKPRRNKASQDLPDDIITLFILAPFGEEKFTGDQINSAARASGLMFGDMNIYHRMDGNDAIQFSLANMLKPGSFDPEKLYDIETSGVTLFMQARLVADAEAVLDDMLQTAYQMSEMLGGKLCNHRREPLTEQDANRYREQIASLTADA